MSDQSVVCRMKCTAWLLFASSLLLVRRTLVIRAQRTHARQGANREPPPVTVKIPGQGIVLGKEVRHCYFISSNLLTFDLVGQDSFANLRKLNKRE